MNFIKKLLEKRNFDRYWSGFHSWNYQPNIAQDAQSLATVYSCVAAISEAVATLPLHLYKSDKSSGKKAGEHPLYNILHTQPNDEQTSLEFREMMTASVLLTGNAYARIYRDKQGQVIALIPIQGVQVLRTSNNRLAYEYPEPRTGELIRLLDYEVLHLRHRLDKSGVLGVSPIALARGVIDMALAEQLHGINTFNNGAKLAGVLEFPAKLKPEQYEKLKESWSSNYSGANGAGKTPILEEGIKYSNISMNLQDSQWISSRKFSVEEICRLFRISPVIIGDLTHGNYSNSQEMARQFVTLTLRRWLTMWEQSINTKLLSTEQQRFYYVEHSLEGLLRGDSNNRADFYTKGITAGWLKKSEARSLENLPAIEGIDDAAI